ncbi:MAG: hypothetical protein WC766_03100 [Patescibacteria group bacterium]
MPFLRRCLMVIGACLVLLPFRASAQQVNLPSMQLGMIGSASKSPIQISENRVTYRFDQGGTGKSAQSVPVQMTYRLHNPAATQTLEVYVPVAGQEGDAPEVTAIFVNGKEQPLTTPTNQRYFGLDQPIRSVAFNLTLPKDADAIVDVRALQPITGENIPFAIQTARAWSDKIPTGTLEAFFSFTTANWNVALRELKAEPTLIPLTYSGHTASWTLTNLDPQTASDVFWQTADLQAMAYYEQGLDLWRQNNSDPQAYEILHNAMLDMIPCHGEQMPLATWWSGTYDTVTVGILSALPPGDEQDIGALKNFSADWAIPQGDDKSCTAMQQRPERYRSALGYLMQIPKEQRSAAVQQALEKHFNFLNKLIAIMGENSLGLDKDNLPSTDPLGNAKLSEKDKKIVAIWDYRFNENQPAGPSTTSTNPTASPAKTNFGSAVSSTISGILQKLPKLSFGSQIVLFALLALIVLIIIGFIVFKWQETPTIPERPKETTVTPPTVPLMGSGLGHKVDFTKSQPTPDAEIGKHEPENIFKPQIVTPPPVAPTVKSWEPPKPMTSPPKPEEIKPLQRPNEVNNNEPKPPLTI